MMRLISKVLFFFNASEKKKFIFIFACISLTALIEMGVVAAIFPFMAVVAKPEAIQTNYYISQIYHALPFSEPKHFMLFLGGGLVSFLIFGNAFSALTSWIMLRFCYHQGQKISCRLLEKYLSQPYPFFLYRSSSDLAKNVIPEVDRVVMGILISALNSLSKFFVIVSIFTLLVMVSPSLAFAILFILVISYLLVFFSVRKKLIEAGKSASEITTLRLKTIYEAIGSIKELKVLGREQYFLQKLENCAKPFVRAETISQLSPFVMRYIVEVIAFGGMLLIALYLIYIEKDVASFFPLLALYALAGYRLMPAMQQMFTGLTALKYHHSALEILYEEMQLPNKKNAPTSKKFPFENEIVLHHIHYTYPQTESRILKEINFCIKKHSTIGIVGTSGAGKTTLVDIILGLLIPTQGKLLIDGHEVREEDVSSWQSQIGYVPQNIFLIDGTIASNIALGIEKETIDMNMVRRAATLANLHDFIQQLPEGYHTSIGERGIRLSGGQRQRIGIARALYHDPQFLMFDEATSALDGCTERAIIDALQNLGHTKTIILIAHRLNTVKNCDVIYVLDQGEIVGKGKYDDLCENNPTFQYLVNGYLKKEEISETPIN